MSYSLGVTVTTIGRLSLAATLKRASFAEVHVVADPNILRRTLHAAAIVCEDFPNVHIHLGKGEHTWGDRNAARSSMRSSHFAWIDDDDVYTVDAWEKMEKGIAKNPEGVNLFRALYPNGKLLWKEGVPMDGNICTPNIVVPNASWVPEWGDERAAAEYFFERVQKAANREGVDLLYHDEITALIRPVTDAEIAARLPKK